MPSHNQMSFVFSFILTLCLLFPTQSLWAAARDHARLWNTHEFKRPSLKRLRKWRAALKRYDLEKPLLSRPCHSDGYKSCGLSKWWTFINGLKGRSFAEQLHETNRYVNRYRYVRDFVNWGVPDYWESPGQFYDKQGDCEDYAIVKYMTLRALGFTPDELRIIVVKDLNLNTGHALLAVYRKGRILLLDNQIDKVVESTRVRHYGVRYSLNENYWWLHLY